MRRSTLPGSPCRRGRGQGSVKMEALPLGGGARRQISRNNRRLHKDSFSAPPPQPRRAQVPPPPWQDISAIMARLVARLARDLKS